MTLLHDGPHLLLRRLETSYRLSDEEQAAVTALPIEVARVPAGTRIVREGERPTRCFVVLDGFTCTYNLTGEGRRQISCFGIAGDIPDLQSLHLHILDCNIGTVVQSRVGFIPHKALRALCLAHPRLMEAFWRQTLIEGAIYREWVLNIGQRRAPNRLAHVFCEIMIRMEAVGLAEDKVCSFPFTQDDLADATGITTVHANRSLQHLRELGLVTLANRTLAILDWERLVDFGDFEPTYLHLTPSE